MPSKSPKKSQEPIAANAMANCVFPEDLMLCILTRLPVKSIIRFKSVCKPWCQLFSTPEFIKMHHVQFSSDPKNQSFIVHRIDKNYSNTISLFNIKSNVKKQMILDHPFSSTHVIIDVFSITIPSSKVDFEAHQMVSLGFRYDAERADFKVVRIFSLKMNIIGVEVYSVNSDSWRTIEVDFQFNVLETKSVVIVNGNPYWVAKVDRNDRAKSEFDNERVESLDAWVFDDGEQIWRKDHTFRPIEVNMDRLLWCSKKGEILGERADGKLFVFDPKSGCVKFLFYTARQPQSFETHRYAESLAYIKGMIQVNARRERKMVDDATRRI
ncbi:hypothetical protein DH2020_005665 [Rehmannia glutinosa]|uniref:F-box domain-containing protein n=1 Tax=Rehmannia glutinosa TaxID=99300 RepID=A0ABR0XGS0_REHGL